jgi:pectinesterase
MIRRTSILFVFIGVVLFVVSGAIAEEQTLTVAANGSGQFTTVQEAVNAAPAKSKERTIIVIQPGTYKERITVPKEKVLITFRGTDPNTTILTYDLNADSKEPNSSSDSTKTVGTTGSSSTIILAHDFTAENVTFENTAGKGSQAVALKGQADRLIFRNCRFLGWQDTLYSNLGRQYFYRCTIEGGANFILGAARAYFDDCIIHSREGGCITSQGRANNNDANSGFVLYRCRLLGDAPTYLGRAWKSYALTIFDRCWMDSYIRPEGWDNGGSADNEKTAFFAEYKSEGPGANPTARVSWSHQLTDEEVQAYSAENFLKGTDNWNPAAEMPKAAEPAAVTPNTEKVAAAQAARKVVNSVCPIEGTKIDPTNVPDSQIRTYKGKKVGFCCTMCPTVWDKLSDEEKDAKLQAALANP